MLRSNLHRKNIQLNTIKCIDEITKYIISLTIYLVIPTTNLLSPCFNYKIYS